MTELFFKPTSPLPMALFRIGVGLLVQFKVILLWPSWRLWLTDAGPFTQAASERMTGGSRLHLWNLLTDWSGPYAAYAQPAYLIVLYLLGISIMLGCLTRLTSFLAFVMLVSIHHRNTMILHSGDTLMRLQLFALLLSPAGMALSLDLKIWKKLRGILAGHSPSGALHRLAPRLLTLLGCPDPAQKVWAPWAQRLMQAQLMVAYFATALWKASGSMWHDGTALYVASQLDEFTRVPIPWLYDSPWFHLGLAKLFTWGTLGLEFVLGALLWLRPLRPYLLWAGVGLHLGIELTMNVPIFQWAMLVTYAAFLDPKWIEARLPT